MNSTSSNTQQNARNWVGFLVVQIVVVTAAVAATSQRADKLLRRPHPLPPMRDMPLEVRPLYDDPRVITDEQLEQVLFKLRPRLRTDKPKINHVDHALRFWGVDAVFDDPESLSGEEMRQILINHEKYMQFWGEDSQPLLINDEKGVAIRTRQGLSTASHYDHTLAGLAEVGTPLDFEVRTPNGTATVRSMLEYTLRDFSLNQVEYEWSALAFTLYLPPSREWYTSEGQKVNFDVIADRIMRQTLNRGVCMGNHRLHALVMMLRVDDDIPILSEQGREKILDHLRDVTARFVQHQTPDGYWNRNWPDGTPLDDGAEETLDYKILATGHVLEWWALAPEEVHPPRETVIRGGQWLTRTITEMDDATVKELYTYLTHAGRALALWRGEFPVYFLERIKFEKPADEAEANGGSQATIVEADVDADIEPTTGESSLPAEDETNRTNAAPADESGQSHATEAKSAVKPGNATATDETTADTSNEAGDTEAPNPSAATSGDTTSPEPLEDETGNGDDTTPAG